LNESNILFYMAMREQVGRAIATELFKDQKDIPDYEFPDSGHVKVNLTRSDVALLDALPSELDSSRSCSITTETIKHSEAEIVRDRLKTSIAVLLTCGLFGYSSQEFSCFAAQPVYHGNFAYFRILVNIFEMLAGNGIGLVKTLTGVAAVILAFFVRDWYRLHGQKLSRRLKPLFNVSQLIVNWNIFPWFDIFASDKETIAGKYLFNAEGPILNEENPRTPNKRCCCCYFVSGSI
uniref:RSN1_7TM domain-containing protein n=1 Tax=Anisakis simplex TaxID=6269 RepID=A0A0M3K8L5_ANISI